MKVVVDIPEILLDRIKSAKCIPDMYGSDIVNTVVCVSNATPYEERPRGEWEACLDTEYCKCSYCGTVVMLEESVRFHFCPNCGADNRGGEKK